MKKISILVKRTCNPCPSSHIYIYITIHDIDHCAAFLLLVPHILFLFRFDHLTLVSFNLVLKSSLFAILAFSILFKLHKIPCLWCRRFLTFYFYFNLVLKISFVVLDFSNLLKLFINAYHRCILFSVFLSCFNMLI